MMECRFVSIGPSEWRCPRCEFETTAVGPAETIHRACPSAKPIVPKGERKHHDGPMSTRDPSELPCAHRGAVVRKDECQLCGGERLLVPVYACGLHGTCALGSYQSHRPKGAPTICFTCADRCEASPSQPATDPRAGVPVLVGPEVEPQRLAQILSGPVVSLPAGWQAWLATAAAQRLLIQQRDANPRPYPGGHGRGIVYVAGGGMYFGCLFASLSALRGTGCRLPVEVWTLGPHEWDHEMTAAVESLGAVVCELGPMRIVGGWEAKVHAVARSNFEEVLFLDADCLPVRDPTFLFDDPFYSSSTALFWPDLPPSDRRAWLPDVCWQAMGLEPVDEPDFESGQLLVHRRLAWRALDLAVLLNEQSDFWYRIVYGDKSTWHLAWRRAKLAYHLAEDPAGWIAPAIQQYWRGELLFQHVVSGKRELVVGERIRGLLRWREVKAAAELRAEFWGPGLWSWERQNEQEAAIAADQVGRWQYERVGLGVRALELLPGGQIGDGAAGCERRWSVRLIDTSPDIPWEHRTAHLLIMGQCGHKQNEVATMVLRQRWGEWVGNWTVGERCGAILRRPR